MLVQSYLVFKILILQNQHGPIKEQNLTGVLIEECK